MSTKVTSHVVAGGPDIEIGTTIIANDEEN
jgi:hypothetical protein